MPGLNYNFMSVSLKFCLNIDIERRGPRSHLIVHLKFHCRSVKRPLCVRLLEMFKIILKNHIKHLKVCVL